jgi:4-oxalocrotonate tautomerase
MVEIEDENMRSVTTLYIDEVKQGDWGMDGKCMSAGNVYVLQSAK